MVLIAHATASKVRCISWNHSVPENVIVLNILPMVKYTRSITPLLLGFLTVGGTGLMP